MRRKQTHTVRCAESNCGKSSIYEFDSKREMLASDVTRKPWRCLRHSMPDRVLSMENRHVEWVSEPNVQRSYGRFFGSDGLLVHRAFYVAARDFPPGARVKVTCEVILPDGVV